MTGDPLDRQVHALRQVDERLNDANREQRLRQLKAIVEANELGIRDAPISDEVNNHVHTTFSFSPYSPTCAAFLARYAGLQAVGSIDHDSIGAARELMHAGRILAIGTTVGYELRVSFFGTALEGLRLNNPDSTNIGYIVIHGVPEPAIDAVAAFLRPIQAARNARNRLQVRRLNAELERHSIEPLDFDADVLAISQAPVGGAITERHILYALSRRLLRQAPADTRLSHYLSRRFGAAVAPRLAELIDDPDNPHRIYDLLGVLKSSFLPQFYVQPDERECIGVREAVEFAASLGAIPCYGYLGDVTESPTGDKKPEKFEDDFLDELFCEIKRIGFLGLTYMPPRNTLAQLKRVIELCRRYDLMEISGVDINSSRQLFNCPEILQPQFRHLIDNTWALIAHEKLASCDASYGIFDPRNRWAELTLTQRLERYRRLGEKMDPQKPESVLEVAGETT